MLFATQLRKFGCELSFEKLLSWCLCWGSSVVMCGHSDKVSSWQWSWALINDQYSKKVIQCQHETQPTLSGRKPVPRHSCVITTQYIILISDMRGRKETISNKFKIAPTWVQQLTVIINYPQQQLKQDIAFIAWKKDSSQLIIFEHSIQSPV